MRQRLKPMLFDDEYLEEANATRASPVAKAVRSDHAKVKYRTKHAEDGLPLHSFTTLLKDLATLTYNIARTGANPHVQIVITSRPTPIQAKAFELLRRVPTVPSSPTLALAQSLRDQGLAFLEASKFGLDASALSVNAFCPSAHVRRIRGADHFAIVALGVQSEGGLARFVDGGLTNTGNAFRLSGSIPDRQHRPARVRQSRHCALSQRRSGSGGAVPQRGSCCAVTRCRDTLSASRCPSRTCRH